MAEKKKGGIKNRTVISLLTSMMFLVMAVTGLILFIVPQGKTAYWVDWRFWGMSKTQWGDIHIVASVVFVVAGVWHLYYNWRPFLGHLRKKAEQGVRIRVELLITLLATALLTAGAIFSVPPVSYLLQLNAHIKDSWIENHDDEPPFGHAELLSLRSFCTKTDIDLDSARRALEAGGVVVDSDKQIMGEIAVANQMAPRDVYVLIKDLSVVKAPVKGEVLDADKVVELFEGKGVGRLTIADACARAGQEVTQCLERMNLRGLRVDEGDTIKKLAERENEKPIKILQMMLVDEPDR